MVVAPTFVHANLRMVTVTKKFAQLANWVAVMSGHPVVFGFAILTVVAWMATGPFFSILTLGSWS
jgi:Low affinity iron permease